MAVGNATGTTIAFSSGSTYSAQILSFTLDGEEIVDLDFSHLGSTDYRELKPGSLAMPPTLTVEINFDPATPPPMKTVATCTITFNGGSNTFSGTGYFKSRSVPISLEEKMTATYVWQFDGATGPAFA